MALKSGRGRRVSVLLTGIVVIAAATILPSAPAAAATVSDAWTDKARYAPGQSVVVTAAISGTGSVDFEMTHLGETVRSGTVQASGGSEVSWTVTPPTDDFRGYHVEVTAGSTRAYTAVDVSSTWTRFPRTGYLDSYPAGMTASQRQQAVDELSRKYHLNTLQFYDWMWRHEKPIQRTSGGGLVNTWTAWNGDVIAPSTVDGLVDAAHAENMAALPYTMSYAALEGFQTNGVSADWRLKYRSNGSDWKFQMLPNRQDTTLWMMNPRNSNWKSHIVNQYVDQINTFGFDGTHLDQLGNWGGSTDGGMNDVNGNAVDIPAGFAELVNATKSSTGKPVGFNAVDGFSSGSLAASDSDYLYSELWDGHESYSAVQSYLQSQRAASGGKPHVLAAYLNYKSNVGPKYEAESAARTGVGVATNHAGFSGTGFVDQFGEVGDSVTFSVNAPESRRYGVVPAWSNGTSTTATRTIKVDGSAVSKWSLPGTGGWGTWSSESGTSVYLTAGTHTITVSVESGDTGFVNLDSLTLGTFNTASVQLANAAFAANGAHHIEMGQGDQMLVAPYFLDHSKQMTPELSSWMQNHYDVITAYENLLFGPTLQKANNTTVIAGQATSNDGAGDKIWTNAMRNNGVDVLHLINLKGNDNQWRNVASAAPTLSNLPVKYYLGTTADPAHVRMASPDRDGGASTDLSFTIGTDGGGRYVSFTVPELKNWNFIYLLPSGGAATGDNISGVGGKCMDVAGGNSANGTQIQLWDCADVPAMQWTFQNGKLSALGKCLDLVQGGTANGTLTHLWDCHSGQSQTWERTGANQFRNPVSGRCLDTVGGSSTNGTRLHLWDCYAIPSQTWTGP